MNAVVDLLRELDRHHVAVIRHGDRIKLKAEVGVLPVSLVERARRLKPDLLRVVPDAGARPVLHFRLPDHAPGAVATMIGRPGQSRDALLESMLARWPRVEVLS